MRKDERLLPDWNGIGQKLVLGIKIVIVYLVYLLPVILLLIPLFPLAILTDQPEAGRHRRPLQPRLLLRVRAPDRTVQHRPDHRLPHHQLQVRPERADRRRARHWSASIKDFRKNWQNVLVVALITIGVQSFAWIGIVLFLVGVVFTILYSYMVPAYLSGMLYLDVVRKERVVVR